MAKVNYRFDKRQRELKKVQKQEEKRLKKLARSAAAGGDAPAEQSTDGTSEPPEQTQ